MSDELAFRRLVVCVSNRLSDEQMRTIVYTRLYTQKERLRDAHRLDIFAELECRGVFSPAKPEGLLDIVENDLQNREVANFITKELKKKAKRKGETRSNPAPTQPALDHSSPDSHLRICYNVALAQANVLLQQLEVLRHVVEAGAQQRDKANEAIEGISNSASELTRRLKKSRKELGLSRSLSGSSTGSDETSSSTLAEDYECPQPLPINPKTKQSPPPPPPKPRLVPAPTLPQQETYKDHDSLLTHSDQACLHVSSERWSMSLPSSPAPARPIRYAKQGYSPIPRDRHPLLPGSHLVLPRTPPAVPPRKRGNQQVPTPEPSTDEGEYQVLRPDLEQDGSADSGMGSGGTGSGDGGFTDPRRYRKPDFPPRNVRRHVEESPENRQSYKPLERNTLEELLEYTTLNRKPV